MSVLKRKSPNHSKSFLDIVSREQTITFLSVLEVEVIAMSYQDDGYEIVKAQLLNWSQSWCLMFEGVPSLIVVVWFVSHLF